MGSMKDKIKGTAKELEGRLTGDKLRTAQGKATKAKGEVKAVAERASEKLKAGVGRAKGKIKRARARVRARGR